MSAFGLRVMLANAGRNNVSLGRIPGPHRMCFCLPIPAVDVVHASMRFVPTLAMIVANAMRTQPAPPFAADESTKKDAGNGEGKKRSAMV